MYIGTTPCTRKRTSGTLKVKTLKPSSTDTGIFLEKKVNTKADDQCPVLDSLSGRTCYRKISWSLETARLQCYSDRIALGFDRQRWCQGTCQISERLEKFKDESRGLETSRDLAVRRPSAQWIEACAAGSFCFPDLVTGSGSANPFSTARGLSATQREACMRSLTTQKPKRLPRVLHVISGHGIDNVT